GRIAELAGEKAKGLDVRMRTLGFRRNAEKHAKILNEETRSYLEKYAAGVNAFLETRPGDVHLEFKLAGLKPGRWSPVDSLTILYYMGWGSAANFDGEIVAQMLVEKVGLEKAREIFPLNINPDAEHQTGAVPAGALPAAAFLGLTADSDLLAYVTDRLPEVGSNNWAAGPARSASGKPIVANDPHLDARILPGPWYPCGMITPDLRAVGVTIAGVPGMVIGRTDRFAIGVTNAYGDAQDLYVETVDPADPGRYLEKDQSLPFEVVEELLKIKDKNAPGGFREEKVAVRLTKRGPVISEVFPDLRTDKVITARWSSYENMRPTLGFERLLDCRNVEEIRAVLEDVNQIALNFVFADVEGDLGWQTTGRLPIRSQGEAIIPFVVQDGEDNWTGWVPWEDMPHAVNPDRGWVGTCNHYTVPPDYPYYYTTHVSPSYRQRRLIELLDAPGRRTAEDHWAYQRDMVNTLAQKIAPVMVQALAGRPDTEKMAALLAKWDFVDRPDQAAPAVFQSVYREFALLVFRDELGEDLVKVMLGVWYFWQERLQRMVLDGDSPWFDDVGTQDRTETRDELFQAAALKALENLRPALGDDPAGWQWGKLHQQEFVSPLRRSGPGAMLLGGGAHSAPGSGETLYRGIYDFNDPYKVVYSASLRMVADLGDPDKVLAVLPGGIAGRQFDPLTTNQIGPFMTGEKVYWWFSDRAIKEHAHTTQTLEPR
ncbi:MAG: penicillin acylase family protein, partial [Thermodesulfobacteriota bacterium]